MAQKCKAFLLAQEVYSILKYGVFEETSRHYKVLRRYAWILKEAGLDRYERRAAIERHQRQKII